MEVKIKGLRADGELLTEELSVLFRFGKGAPAAVMAIDVLSVEDGEGELKVEVGDPHCIPTGEYPGLQVFITHAYVAWLVESGVIIE